MGFKCLFKGHKWVKIGGPTNIGGGKFRQELKCTLCGKRKMHVS